MEITNHEIIKKCYKQFLNREPDEKGFNHYLQLFESDKIDELKFINEIKNSVEYKKKISSKKFDYEYEDFLKKCYNKILDREPDENGFNYYLNLLLTEKIKIKELEGIFKNSKEYKIHKIILKTKDISSVSKIFSQLGIKTNFTDQDDSIINSVYAYTMTYPNTIYSLIECVKWVINNKISGDIVECGVWKGGSMLTIIKTLLNLNSKDKNLYLYDTFEGWPEKTEFDIYNKINEQTRFSNEISDLGIEMGHDESHQSFLQEVKNLLYSTKYPTEKIYFIKGIVQESLPKHTPSNISILRLDTDYYESTKHELIHLFPKLSIGGFLIIDDYDIWEGQKKAVDEYFSKENIVMKLYRIERGVRIGIKE